MPIKDPFGESTSLLSSGSSSHLEPQEQGLSRFFIVSWRVILLVILSGGIAMTYYDRTMLSIGVGPDFKSTPVAVSSAALLTFYAGCMLTSLPGGRLAEVYGGKLVMVYGVLLWALANLGLAFCGSHEAALIPLRGLEGLAQGVVFPATFHLISAWFPERERTSSVAASLSGVDLGIYITVLNLPAYLSTSSSSSQTSSSSSSSSSSNDGDFEDGVSSSSRFLASANNDDSVGNSGSGDDFVVSVAVGMSDRWAVHFIVLGVVGVAWCIAAGSLTSSTPEWHPRISLPEVQFITKERKQSMALLDSAASLSSPVNWPMLLRHPALLTIYATHAIASLVFHTSLLALPLFCQDEFDLSLAAVAPYATFPCAASITASLMTSLLCDRTITSGRVGRRRARVRASLVGLVVPALAIPILKLCAPNAPLALGVVTVAAAAAGVGPKAGWLANILDVAPNHAGLVMGIASAASIVPAILVASVFAYWGSAATAAVNGWGWAVCACLSLCSAGALFSVGCSDTPLII